MPTTDSTCPICQMPDTKCNERPDGDDGNLYDCPNCGKYFISRTALSSVANLDKRTCAVLSHEIWKKQPSDGTPPRISTLQLDAAKKGTLPDPAEQLDLLILYMGIAQKSSGSWERYHFRSQRFLTAKIGGLSEHDVDFAITSLTSQGFIDNKASNVDERAMRLTLKGWQRFHELQRGAVHNRTAFMAMSFSDDELTRFIKEHFYSAVADTGFLLKRLDDHPQAGVIDNLIRVEIRLCRFLIADLTDENRGAYWEAGYAEGLGKPVIYTCKKTHFDEHKTHFDTNHCQTVLWDPDDPVKSVTDLKATIRATLPFEANMQDAIQEEA